MNSMDTCASTKVMMGFRYKIFSDPSGDAIDQKKYMGMIRSSLYLTLSRQDTMLSTCLYARFQANPKISHLLAVKKKFGISKTKKTWNFQSFK